MKAIATGAWAGRREAMVREFSAEQSVERERLKCERQIEARQLPENRSNASLFTQFNRYGWKKEAA